MTQALAATGFYYVIGQPAGRPSWDVHVRRDADRVGTGNAATASSNPPLYYLAQAAVYRAAHGPSVLDRLALMRILSARAGGADGAVRVRLPARAAARVAFGGDDRGAARGA